MSMVPSAASAPQGPSGGQISDVVGLILDKGLVIDIYARVSLVGIEVLTLDARVVVASVDTYLRFAEAVGRLNIQENDQSEGLPQLIESMTSGGAESKTKGAIEGVKDKLFGSDDDGNDDDDSGSKPRRASSSSSGSKASRSSSGSGSSSGSRSRSRSSRSESS